MFGFSFTKVLLLVAVVAFVWFGWRWFQRWEAERRAMARDGERVPPAQRRLAAEDMVACRRCGTYVAARGAKACGKGDCPYPR